MRRRCGLLLALLPVISWAGSDGARQWPVTLSRPDAGAYRIELGPEVYAAASQQQWRDVQVLDAAGKLVASEVFMPPALPVPAVRTINLAWFPLPAKSVDRQGPTAISVQQDGRGTVTTIRNTPSVDAPGTASQGWLIDRGANAGRLVALTVKWSDHATPVDARFRLEASNDLRDWHLLDPAVWLLQLSNRGEQLRRARISVDTTLRYLRLQPLDSNAEFVPQAFEGTVHDKGPSANWLWQDVQADADRSNGYHYLVRGRFPVERLAVELPPNSTARWAVSSADPDHMRPGQGVHWRELAADWSTWNLSADGRTQRSAPLDLGSRITNREWRLRPIPGGTLGTPPVLRLGFRAGSLVFLAQGTPPYRLVAGSTGPGTAHAQLEPMLSDLRARHGNQWQPASADLGAGSARIDAVISAPASAPRQWKNLLLWGVLILGSVLVAGFAISLLRGQPVDQDST